jgi:hypothetical protein
MRHKRDKEPMNDEGMDSPMFAGRKSKRGGGRKKSRKSHRKGMR